MLVRGVPCAANNRLRTGTDKRNPIVLERALRSWDMLDSVSASVLLLFLFLLLLSRS